MNYQDKLKDLEDRLNDRNDMQHEYTAWTVAIEAIALARSLEAELRTARAYSSGLKPDRDGNLYPRINDQMGNWGKP